MEPEIINLPDIVTGISLSAGAIQLITHCIANCPLTALQRENLNKELVTAIREAVKEPNNGLHKVDGLGQRQCSPDEQPSPTG